MFISTTEKEGNSRDGTSGTCWPTGPYRSLQLKAYRSVWFGLHVIFKSVHFTLRKNDFWLNLKKQKIFWHGAHISTTIRYVWVTLAPNLVRHSCHSPHHSLLFHMGLYLCSCASLTPAVGNILNFDWGFWVTRASCALVIDLHSAISLLLHICRH